MLDPGEFAAKYGANSGSRRCEGELETCAFFPYNWKALTCMCIGGPRSAPDFAFET